MARSRKAEAAAEQVLREARVKSPPVDVVALLAQRGVRVERQALEDHVSGCLLRSAGRVLVVVNNRHAPARQNFTLAHELGHFVLHGSQPSLFVDNEVIHFRVGSGSTDPKELEANAFAATLLMPEFMLKAELRDRPIDAFDEDAVQRMARQYGVSQQALTIQLVSMGLLDGLSKRRS